MSAAGEQKRKFVTMGDEKIDMGMDTSYNVVKEYAKAMGELKYNFNNKGVNYYLLDNMDKAVMNGDDWDPTKEKYSSLKMERRNHKNHKRAMIFYNSDAVGLHSEPNYFNTLAVPFSHWEEKMEVVLKEAAANRVTEIVEKLGDGSVEAGKELKAKAEATESAKEVAYKKASQEVALKNIKTQVAQEPDVKDMDYEKPLPDVAKEASDSVEPPTVKNETEIDEEVAAGVEAFNDAHEKEGVSEEDDLKNGVEVIETGEASSKEAANKAHITSAEKVEKKAVGEEELADELNQKAAYAGEDVDPTTETKVKELKEVAEKDHKTAKEMTEKAASHTEITAKGEVQKELKKAEEIKKSEAKESLKKSESEKAGKKTAEEQAMKNANQEAEIKKEAETEEKALAKQKEEKEAVSKVAEMAKENAEKKAKAAEAATEVTSKATAEATSKQEAAEAAAEGAAKDQAKQELDSKSAIETSDKAAAAAEEKKTKHEVTAKKEEEAAAKSAAAAAEVQTKHEVQAKKEQEVAEKAVSEAKEKHDAAAEETANKAEAKVKAAAEVKEKADAAAAEAATKAQAEVKTKGEVKEKADAAAEESAEKQAAEAQAKKEMAVKTAAIEKQNKDNAETKTKVAEAAKKKEAESSAKTAKAEKAEKDEAEARNKAEKTEKQEASSKAVESKTKALAIQAEQANKAEEQKSKAELSTKAAEEEKGSKELKKKSELAVEKAKEAAAEAEQTAKESQVKTEAAAVEKTKQESAEKVKEVSEKANANIAKGMPAKQVSDGWGGIASRAVDGNTAQSYGDGSCTHTKKSDDPWWGVELKEVNKINTVKVYNRVDCCGSRLDGFIVKVGTQAWTPILAKQCGKAVTKAAAVNTVDCFGMEGQYVYVTKSSSMKVPTYFVLCEVEVTSLGKVEWSESKAKAAAIEARRAITAEKIQKVAEERKVKTETNIAKGRPTHQSCTGWGGVASKAVDGTTDGTYSKGSCTHTKKGDYSPWWAVQLSAQVKVTTVKVFNRGDCCGSRLNNFLVKVGKTGIGHADYNAAAWCGGLNAIEQGASTSVDCEDKIGDAVFIGTTKKQIYLTICEVQVFSNGAAPAPPVNVAKGRPTKQVSTGWGGEAGRAVDGNVAATFSKNSCTHTKKAVNPWWGVELTSTIKVGTVTVYNRGDCCGTRLNGFVVRIGKNSFEEHSTGVKCGSFNPIIQGASKAVDCKGKVGKYVFVTVSKTDYLTICEVKVTSLGDAPPPPPPVMVLSGNIAVGRPAHQVSTGWGGSAGRAVDGQVTSRFSANSCTHTNQAVNPWWVVKLSAAYAIDKVKVFNRGDCCGTRLNGFVVKVGNSWTGVSTASQCGSNNAITQGGSKTVDCGKKTGQFVYVQTIKTDYLTLCEVKVTAWVPESDCVKSTTNHVGEQCSGDDCNAKVSCPLGSLPTSCSTVGVGSGDGAYINAANECVAQGGGDAVAIAPQVTCSSCTSTTVTNSGTMFLDNQDVTAVCPEGSTALDCNCLSHWTTKYVCPDATNGRFAPKNGVCTLTVKASSGRRRQVGHGAGARIYAVCKK